MAKYIIISLSIIIFGVSFYIGSSTVSPVLMESEGEKSAGYTVLPKSNIFQAKLGEKKSETEITGVLKFLVKKERYKLMAGFAKVGTDGHPLINAMIGLENPSEIDHQSMEALNDKLQDYIKENPEGSFVEIKNLLDSFMAKEDPSLRANLLVTASFVPGKEKETQELALNELDNNRIPQDYFDFTAGRTPSQSKKIPGDDIAVVMAYNAYLSASHLDTSEVDNKTIEILKKQTNTDIRRMIALSYNKVFPKKSTDMLTRLKQENLNIFPDNFIANP